MVVNVPLLEHGLHPQVLLGLVDALNVVIIPTQIFASVTKFKAISLRSS